jgi:hypothetical protein
MMLRSSSSRSSGPACSALRSGGLERGAGRDLAVLQVAPQRDRQAPCQGNDAYAPHALASCREAPVDEQGISKAGNKRARALLVELSWGWLRLQPDSELTQWF